MIEKLQKKRLKSKAMINCAMKIKALTFGYKIVTIVRN